MNKKINIILAMLLAVAGVFSLTSCKEDEPKVAKAVLCSVFSLEFDAQGGEQEVKVVSDAIWTVDAPEWITVSPTTGEGTTFVTISANSNYQGSEMMAPRRAEVVFHGNTVASRAVVGIHQAGDGYKGLKPVDGAGFYAVAEEENVVVTDMTVVATYEGGFIATDGTTNVNCYAATAPAKGSVNTLYGARKTDKYGMAYVQVEKTEAGGSVATAPDAVDVTEDVDKDKLGETLIHVSMTGIYDAASNALSISEKTNRGYIVTLANGLDLSSLSSHSLTLDAYYLGTAAPAVNLIVTGYTDNGLAEVVYFQEDWEWLEPWSCQKPAGQTVEDNNPSATAQQLGTNKVDDVSTYQALLARGYSFPICCAPSQSPREPQAQTYLQRNYLKFGLTGFYSGLTFPLMTEVPDGAHTVMCFDWCGQRQGSGKWDDTELVIVVKNGDDEQQFLVPTHTYVNDEVYAWLSVRVDLGTALTNKSVVTIRNIDSQWPDESGRALRWFIDNIKVVEK